MIEVCIKQALAPMHARLLAVETALPIYGKGIDQVHAVAERLASLEARPLPVGPPGPAGPPGQDGKDGQDGKPGLQYLGVYVEGKQYECGDLVTWAGSAWHCNEVTATKPGEASKAWTLMVKRGRDGKDGHP